MASKKQFADMENTILLLEEKVDKLEEDIVTMKQMITMQNSLIDNLQMMIKMMSQQTLTMSVKSPISVLHPETLIGGGSAQLAEHNETHTDLQEHHEVKPHTMKQGGLKHRMSRVA
jgi:hypothetical protein